MIYKSYIAVIVPTYMPGEYLRKCFKSLSRQTLSSDKFCVYVALNGSSDQYKKYVYSLLNDCSFKYELSFLEEPGVSNARNFLIENSIEPYICFVDDDDILSDNYLESLLSAVGNKTIGISNVKVFDESVDDSKVNYIGKRYLKLDKQETSIFKARQYFSSPCAKLIHRDIIGNARFDLNLHRGEDALFMAELSPRVAQLQKGVPEACYYVYQRPGSASRKKVNKKEEVSRVLYLVKCYLNMFFSRDFEKKFIFSRIIATLLHIRRLFN